MNEVRLYGKNRKRPGKGRRSYWTDMDAWRRNRSRMTGRLPVTVNVTTRTRAWSRFLSPILMGPVATYREGGRLLQALSAEVAWQYSKVYSCNKSGGKRLPLNFQKKDGRPNAKWFRWRDRAWSNPRFHWGHPRFAASKHLVRRAFPKGSTVAAWYWDGKLLDPVTARREIYARLYCRFVRRTRPTAVCSGCMPRATSSSTTTTATTTSRWGCPQRTPSAPWTIPGATDFC